MGKYVVYNRDDMVNFICVSLIADGMIVNDDLIHAILDAREEYMINYVDSEEDE